MSGDEPGDPVYAEIVARVWKKAARDHLAELAVPEAQGEAGELLERARDRLAVGDGRDLVHLGAEHEAQQVDRVHAGAHHRGCAPDQLRRVPPLRKRRARRGAVAAAHAERPLRLGEHDAPQRPGGDELARADIGRVLAQVEGNAQRDARAAARLQHSHGVGDRGGHWLLAQHVLAGFRRLDDVLGMQGIRRGHEDAVDTRVLEEVAELTVRGACLVLLRERLRPVLIAAVDADELAVGRGHRRRDLDVWMLARADDAPSERPSTGHRKNSTFASRKKRKFPGAAEIGPLIANTAISNLSPEDTARSASTTRLGMLKPWIAPGLGRPGGRGIAPLIQTSAESSAWTGTPAQRARGR